MHIEPDTARSCGITWRIVAVPPDIGEPSHFLRTVQQPPALGPRHVLPYRPSPDILAVEQLISLRAGVSAKGGALRITVVGPISPREFADVLNADPTQLPKGLVGIPVTELVHELLHLGHFVHVVTASPDITEPVVFRSLHMILSVAPYRQRARNRALDLFRKERLTMADQICSVDVDVVHAHWTYEFAAAALTSPFPTIVTTHDSPLRVLRYSPDAYRLLRAILALFVRIRIKNLTAVSPYLATQWRQSMLYRREILVIPNIAPTLDAKRPGTAGKQADEFAYVQILDIADSSPRKNVKTLIKAFSIVRDIRPQVRWRLVLIGAGLDDDGDLAKWSRTEELSDGIHFMGIQSREAIAEQFASTNIFVHPSLEEAQPMALLEAMRTGVPVIAGDRAGGVPWTLDNGRAGKLVDVTRQERVASAIVSLSEDPAESDELARRAHLLVSERYSRRAVAAKYISSYSAAIAASSKRHGTADV